MSGRETSPPWLVDPDDAPLPCRPELSDFKNVQEEVFWRKPGRRHFDTPCSRHNVLPIRRRDFGKIVSPECLPHVHELGVLRQRAAFCRVEGPILAASPRASIVVTGS